MIKQFFIDENNNFTIKVDIPVSNQEENQEAIISRENIKTIFVSFSKTDIFNILPFLCRNKKTIDYIVLQGNSYIEWVDVDGNIFKTTTETGIKCVEDEPFDLFIRAHGKFSMSLREHMPYDLIDLLSEFR